MGNKNKVIICLKVPPEFRDKIKKISEFTGIKMGRMTEKALDEYIEKHNLLGNNKPDTA